MSEKQDDGRGTFWAGSPWKGLWLGVGAVGLMAALLGVGTAAGGFRHAPGFGHGPRHWGHHGESAEDRAEHARLAAEWVLRWVDATPEQQARVAEIVEAQTPALEDLIARHRASRGAFVAALTAERVDRAALEQARESELALADEASAQLAAALADVAETLTSEQRAELADLAARFAD